VDGVDGGQNRDSEDGHEAEGTGSEQHIEPQVVRMAELLLAGHGGGQHVTGAAESDAEGICGDESDGGAPDVFAHSDSRAHQQRHGAGHEHSGDGDTAGDEALHGRRPQHEEGHERRDEREHAGARPGGHHAEHTGNGDEHRHHARAAVALAHGVGHRQRNDENEERGEEIRVAERAQRPHEHAGVAAGIRRPIQGSTAETGGDAVDGLTQARECPRYDGDERHECERPPRLTRAQDSGREVGDADAGHEAAPRRPRAVDVSRPRRSNHQGHRTHVERPRQEPVTQAGAPGRERHGA